MQNLKVMILRITWQVTSWEMGQNVSLKKLQDVEILSLSLSLKKRGIVTRYTMVSFRQYSTLKRKQLEIGESTNRELYARDIIMCLL